MSHCDCKNCQLEPQVAYLNGLIEGLRQSVAELKADCKTMAAWFKDLLGDDYEYGQSEYPAFRAAVKYIDPSFLDYLKARGGE